MKHRHTPTQIARAYHDALGNPGKFRPVQQFFIDTANRYGMGVRQSDGTMAKLSPLAGADLAVLEFAKRQQFRIENLQGYERLSPDSSMFNLDFRIHEGKPEDGWFLEITRYATRTHESQWLRAINIEPRNRMDRPKSLPEFYILNSQIRIGLWWLPAYLRNLETQSGEQSILG